MCSPKVGLQTGDVDLFVRKWFECSTENLCLNNVIMKEKSVWFPYNNGGEFRKWYGNNDEVVNWKDDGIYVINHINKAGKKGARPQNRDYYFRNGATWSAISSSSFSVRLFPEGFLFSNAGMAIFAERAVLYYIVGFLNSKLAQKYLGFFNEGLGITVSIGVSFNKIFAKLGSDYKKPDAITTMYEDEFKSKAWALPVSDLLYVGRSTNQKLARFGIKTIGDLAQTDEHLLMSQLGKMGGILWAFANGYDDSPVKMEHTHAPIKSIGNSTTTPRDLENDEDVKIVLYILAESVAARLRDNGFKCRVVEISVRDNELYSFTRQHKIDHATNITGEIATEAYRIFKGNYNWRKPIRSVGVRGADLVNDNYWEQMDLFSSVEQREKQMKLDDAVDTIRRRFGFYSVQRGLMYRDKILSSVNAKEDHTTHPIGYFG
jgi:DNA polymerase-4